MTSLLAELSLEAQASIALVVGALATCAAGGLAALIDLLMGGR